ncbi:DMT family transporter [Marinicrinis sediminis]|uniref:DMT family transporter n=1 Tax=Marinicrinis sediminis TaxID=1652465 RepID=A0ABW5R7Q2_9BACL
MAWFSLILAGAFEMVGVAMINQFHVKRSVLSLVLLLLGFGASFVFLSIAMKDISMGTAYAVWTGIGACGSAFVGMIWYGESREWRRILFIGMIIAAVIGLKLIGE